jgi:peroxiredoxin (alkyl hydroperoxide reductase subunit C)
MNHKMKTVAALIIITFFTFTSRAQNIIPLIGNDAPAFRASTTNGKLEFPEDFGKSWKILFSHPKDFTPVCTSEILELARMQEELNKLNVKVAVISVDDLVTHQQWKQTMEDILKKEPGVGEIKFPFIDDSRTWISSKYGMLHSWENKARDVRGVFVIDPENKIQSVIFYPNNVGRNMVEIKRLVVALQTSAQQNVLTPANWEVGEDVLMPYLPVDELSENYEEREYYKVGINLWYKKGGKPLIPKTDKP